MKESAEDIARQVAGIAEHIATTSDKSLEELGSYLRGYAAIGGRRHALLFLYRVLSHIEDVRDKRRGRVR